ncbi:MAG: hypothetical protein IIY94_04370 [Oscillospiraceae bacterium]|nr:hypothetical protein [Oscillospiraceae bacterium]
MQYPNAYEGTKRVRSAELLFLVSAFLSLYPALSDAWLKTSGMLFFTLLFWVSRVGCVIFGVKRMLAIGKAVLDDREMFLPVQKLCGTGVLVTVFSTVLMAFFVSTIRTLHQTEGLPSKILLYNKLYLLLCMVELSVSFCAALDIINCLKRFALRLRKQDECERGDALKSLFSRLMLCISSAFILKIITPGTLSFETTISFVLGSVIFASLIYAWYLYISYLRQAEKMLLYAELKRKVDWSGVARELRPVVVDLYDPDAAEAPRREYRETWSAKDLSRGVARELLPAQAALDTDDDLTPPVPQAPSEPKKPEKPWHSIWEYDLERFFKDRPVELSKEDLETTDLRFPNAYRSLRYLLRANKMCYLSLFSAFFFFSLLSFGFIDLSGFSSVLRIFIMFLPLALFGKISCLLLWRALLRATLDEVAFLSSKKLLTRIFHVIFILFMMPFYYCILKTSIELSVFVIFFCLLQIVWAIAPFPVMLSVIMGLIRLTEKLGEWDLAERLLKLHRRIVSMCCLTSLVLSIIAVLDSLAQTAPLLGSFGGILLVIVLILGLIALWRTVLHELSIVKQALERAKVVHSSADLGAGIDYSKNPTANAEAAQ